MKTQTIEAGLAALQTQHANLSHWPRHWTNGGTGITRRSAFTSAATYAAIAESVRLFGDKQIWMEDGINELHTSRRPFNLSDFWAFHGSRSG